MIQKIFLTLSLLPVLSAVGCVVPYMGLGACVNHNGICIDGSINGNGIVPIGDHEALQQFRDAGIPRNLRIDLDETGYRLKAPVSGKISVKAAQNERGMGWFGPPTKTTVRIVPLAGQQIPNMRAGDPEPTGEESSPVDSTSQSIEQNALPTGPYLFDVRVQGTRNYDHRVVLLNVE